VTVFNEKRLKQLFLNQNGKNILSKGLDENIGN